MNASKKFGKQFKLAKRALGGVRKKIGGAGKGIAAGVTGAALVLGKLGSSVKNKAAGFKENVFHTKPSREVITVKKSTVVALLVALAAVAGVLGALYFYVLRREKELDEYEQLLFSEDFNDDLLDEPEEEPEEEPAPKKAKA